MRLLLLSVIATSVTCDLIRLDDLWLSTSTFQREHGYALIGHVIQTLDVYIAECIEACQKALKCFSYNYVGFHNGSFLCELNQSNKKKSPNSFIPIQSYEYGEPSNPEFCSENTCIGKDALQDGWYRLGPSLLKLFYMKKNWHDARSYCQSLGGDLVSIKSQTENNFIKQVILFPSFRSRVEMNGNDDPNDLSVFEGAMVASIDNVKAVKFDGVDDYAKVSNGGAVFKQGFTIALWTRIQNSGANLLNDAGEGKTLFLMVATSRRSLSFKLKTVEKQEIRAVTPENVFELDKWTHIAVTWNHTAKELRIFINSQLKASTISIMENIELFYTGRLNYTAGKNGRFLLHGWMRELCVFERALSTSQIQKLADGLLSEAWIGMNDIDSEGLFKWSDTQTITFFINPEGNNNRKDCVQLKKSSNFEKKWDMKECNASQPFICEKSAL